jgi:Predicted hydrolase of the alpha/beta superfamily
MPSSKDQSVEIVGPAGALESVLRLPPTPRPGLVAVVCHPHPLHGGTMDNKVVSTLVRSFDELNIASVRFNFRGVGASEGSYGEGIGEVDDLNAVAAWVRQEFAGSQVILAGFSFGSGVVSNGCQTLADVAQGIFVAPPVGRYNFAGATTYPCPITVIMGDKDELVNPEDVYRWCDSLTPSATVISLPEASHFFHGQLVIFREKLVANLKQTLNLE